MKIFIEQIDNTSYMPLGYAKLPSFLVRFRSSAFSGVARLVPGSGLPEDCEGREFEVEIGQDSIAEFCVTKLTKNTGVTALGAAGSFSVQGVVSSVVTATEPIGNQFTYVDAGDAIFTLSLNDTGGIRPDVGACVAFIVKGISFWDEEV